MTFRDWLEWAEPIGLGDLQLLPWDFWRLTPGEFLLRLEGFLRLQNRAWERTGQLGIWTLEPHRKKGSPPLTLRKLIGNRPIWPTRDGDR